MNPEPGSTDSQQPQATRARPSDDYFSNPLMSDFESDWSPIHDAAFQGRLLSLRRLIGQGCSVNLATLDRVTPLHGACLQGHIACARLLIQNGANVNCAAVSWNTPLSDACAGGRVGCVELLLKHGADPRVSDLASPLHEVARKGHTACIELLLSHGADIDHQLKHLGTPLYAACAQQRLESVTKLLQLGANVNSSKDLDSPLHAAARHSRLDLVQVLLNHGADVTSRNTDGKRPVDLAAPHSDVQKLLLQREATIFPGLVDSEFLVAAGGAVASWEQKEGNLQNQGIISNHQRLLQRYHVIQ
ncbi:ankyrin repeat and SOCS box protein 9 isoform X1 [Amia ocellicauda]|uniref:ankyrin repeat and SOCS box protein 9 isoform X1 n=1 Tax=Amia ocellicauda TaxID=2972642 RepID=UPI003463AB15